MIGPKAFNTAGQVLVGILSEQEPKQRASLRKSPERAWESTFPLPYFLVLYCVLPSRCLESEMGPQIPPASIVTKVWVIGVYDNAAE